MVERERENDERRDNWGRRSGEMEENIETTVKRKRYKYKYININNTKKV